MECRVSHWAEFENEDQSDAESEMEIIQAQSTTEGVQAQATIEGVDNHIEIHGVIENTIEPQINGR